MAPVDTLGIKSSDLKINFVLEFCGFPNYKDEGTPQNDIVVSSVRNWLISARG